MKRVYSPTFKAQVTLELLMEEKSLVQPGISREHGVHVNVLRKWKAVAIRDQTWVIPNFQGKRRAGEVGRKSDDKRLIAERNL